MYDSYLLTDRQLPYIQAHCPVTLDMDAYEYFVETTHRCSIKTYFKKLQQIKTAEAQLGPSPD